MLFEGLIIIGLAVLLFYPIWMIVKKQNIVMREKIFFCAFNLIMFIFSVTLIGQLNFAGDEITIVATNQIGSQSQSSEVFLDHFVIDAKEYEITEIVQGKWYFDGRGIFWKDTNVHTELVGMTNTVVIRMPVGTSRQLYFNVSEYRGYVQIFDGEEEYNVDTSVTEFINLESSPWWKIVGTLAIRCILILLVMAGSWGLSLFILRSYRYSKGGIYHIIALPVCMLIFIFMWHNGDAQCFWIDELYQIAYISGNLGDVLTTSMNSISDPPIYNTLAWIWYNIFPHSEKWLLLLPELLTIISIYFMGYFATVNQGLRSGVITLILTASMELVYTQFAFENRQYALWFLMCILLFQAHTEFVENKTQKAMGIYILMLVLAVLTQYISIFLCLAFFVCDIILWKQEINDKRDKRLLIPYLIGGAAALPFGIIILVKYIQRYDSSTSSFLEFWANAPDMNSIIETLLYLIRSNVVWLFLLVFGCAHIIMRLIKGKAQWQEWILLEIPIMFFVLNYFYSTCINRAGSFWVSRYFTMLLPQIIMICALEVEYLVHYFSTSKTAAKTMILGIAFFLGIQCWNNVVQRVSSDREAYEEAADWLYDQTKDIYEPTTLVIDCEDVNANRGWYSYYLTKDGLRDDINCISFRRVDYTTLMNYEKIYLVHLHKAFEEDETLMNFLGEYYEKCSGKSSLSIKEYKLKK